MALLLRDLPGYIQDELNSRRSTLEAQAPKSAWFRFTSNANPEGQESGQVLMGGAFAPSNEGFGGNIPAGFFGQYSFGEGEAARPEPGAVSASVSKKGDDLDISVEWKCWTPQQLDELAPYFLTPGITVILEMGWSDISASQRSAVVNVDSVEDRRELYRNSPPGDDENTYTLDGEGGPIHPRIERRARGGGKYDIYVGRIGNFNISYNDSGGFDCTTEVIGVSTSIFALRGVDQKQRNNDGEGGEQAPKKPTLFEFVTERSAGDPDQGPPYTLDEIDKEDVGTGNWAAVGQYEYLSWEAVERAVLNPYVSYRNAQAEGQDVLYWDSSNVTVSYFPRLLTTEPSTCLIVPRDTAMPAGPVIPAFSKGADIDSQKRGKLYNLYISKKTIKETVEEKKNATIGEIVIRIFEKCNEACFGIWDFQVQEEANNLKVIDRNATGIVDEQEPFTFRPYTSDTIVDSFGIDVTLDDLAKSQVLVGSKVSDDGRDQNHNINGGVGSGMAYLFGEVEDAVDPRGLENPGEPRSSPGENQKATGGRAPVDLTEPAKGEELALVEDRASQDLPESLQYNKVEGWQDLQLTKEEAREIRQEINKDTSEDSPTNANRNLPISVNLELQGIGGLEKFQAFDVANLPESLDQGVFMVKSVEHQVDENSWTTSVEGQYRTTNQFVPSEE